MRNWLAAGFLVTAMCALMPGQASAAVALAVGVTGNPSDGIAIGYAYNYDSEDEAKSTALDQCRRYEAAPKANKQCRLIGSLTDGCVAAAFDPKSDSPGMGWAVTDDRDSARRRALSDCRAAAPSSRREFCQVDIIKCEGDEPPSKR